MNTIGLLVGLPASMLAGSVLHELTHAAAARVAGAEVCINLWRREVVYELPVERSTLVDRCINLSPQIVGAVIGAVFYLGYGLPSTMLGSLGATSWAVYTLWGSVEDFSLSAAHGEVFWGEKAMSRWKGLNSVEQSLVAALACGVGTAGLYVTAYAFGGRVGTTLLLMSWALGLAALLLGAAGAVSLEARRSHASRGR